MLFFLVEIINIIKLEIRYLREYEELAAKGIMDSLVNVLRLKLCKIYSKGQKVWMCNKTFPLF